MSFLGRFAVTLSIGIAFVIGGANCGSVDCNLVIDCGPPISVDAQLPQAAATLSGASLTFCINKSCATGTLVGLVATLTAPSLTVDVKLIASRDTLSDAVFVPRLNGFVDNDGDVHDGDEVEVKIANGDTVLIDVLRKIDYQHGSAGCRNGSCYTANYTITPSSASGVECHMEPCNTTVLALTGTFTTTDFSTPVTATACRDSICGEGTAAVPVGDISGDGPALPTDAHLYLAFTHDGGNKFDFELDAYSFLVSATDPYHDGDVYSVTLIQGGSTLFNATKSVTYVQSFPNGPSCDTTACLNFSGTLD